MGVEEGSSAPSFVPPPPAPLPPGTRLRVVGEGEKENRQTLTPPLPPPASGYPGGGGRGEGEQTKGENPGPIGLHLLLDFYEVSEERLKDADLLAGALIAAAKEAGMTPLSAPILHRFPGGGLTGFLPLAESHIAFHTYPEYHYLAADVFTCGKDPNAPERAFATLAQALQAGRCAVRRAPRGEEVKR